MSMTDKEATQGSVLVRLLEEVSWERATSCREGGRGRENVLSAEVLLALDFLPGDLALSTEVVTGRQVYTQPDALLTSPSAFALVEAKRIRTSAFQAKQLAREYVATLAHADDRAPIIFLLGVKPQFLVKGNGRMTITAAVAAQLESLLAESGDHQLVPERLLGAIGEVFCWISWEEVDTVIRQQPAMFTADDASVQASVQRLAGPINTAITWHS